MSQTYFSSSSENFRKHFQTFCRKYLSGKATSLDSTTLTSDSELVTHNLTQVTTPWESVLDWRLESGLGLSDSLTALVSLFICYQ